MGNPSISKPLKQDVTGSLLRLIGKKLLNGMRMDRRKEKQLSSMVKKMVNGFIVGGTLGGVMYVLVESVFGDKIGQTPKKYNCLGRGNNWVCFC